MFWGIVFVILLLIGLMMEEAGTARNDRRVERMKQKLLKEGMSDIQEILDTPLTRANQVAIAIDAINTIYTEMVQLTAGVRGDTNIGVQEKEFIEKSLDKLLEKRSLLQCKEIDEGVEKIYARFDAILLEDKERRDAEDEEKGITVNGIYKLKEVA